MDPKIGEKRKEKEERWTKQKSETDETKQRNAQGNKKNRVW